FPPRSAHLIRKGHDPQAGGVQAALARNLYGCEEFQGLITAPAHVSARLGLSPSLGRLDFLARVSVLAAVGAPVRGFGHSAEGSPVPCRCACRPCRPPRSASPPNRSSPPLPARGRAAALPCR